MLGWAVWAAGCAVAESGRQGNSERATERAASACAGVEPAALGGWGFAAAGCCGREGGCGEEAVRWLGLLRFGLGGAGVGCADGFAPVVRAKGVDVFVLGKVDGPQWCLELVGDSAGESGFYIAADYGGD